MKNKNKQNAYCQPSQKIEGWAYYNQAVVPNTPPYQEVNLVAIEDKNVWSIDGHKPLLIRWTSDFDCGYETNWWYVIKDDKFDINSIRSKRRYIINKGIKNFEVVKIDPSQYVDELYEVQVKAFSAYPAKYRPAVNEEEFKSAIRNGWGQDYITVYGAFSRETSKLCAYAYLTKSGLFWNYNVQKSDPQYEKECVNLALSYKVVEDFSKSLESGELKWLCDGERNVLHETAFQDFLEKYFNFRKAYCKLNIKYKKSVSFLVKILYPFRKLIALFNRFNIVSKISAVLYMENIVREQNKAQRKRINKKS